MKSLFIAAAVSCAVMSLPALAEEPIPAKAAETRWTASLDTLFARNEGSSVRLGTPHDAWFQASIGYHLSDNWSVGSSYLGLGETGQATTVYARYDWHASPSVAFYAKAGVAQFFPDSDGHLPPGHNWTSGSETGAVFAFGVHTRITDRLGAHTEFVSLTNVGGAEDARAMLFVGADYKF